MNATKHSGWKQGLNRPWVLVLIALVFVVLAWAWNSSQIAARANRPMPTPPPEDPAANAARIRVVEVNSGTYQAELSGFGAARSRYELALTARVSGVVESLADEFESGELVASGATLATLVDTSYRASVATAEQAVANASVALLEEQREVDQARNEWQAAGLGGDPDSPLLLRQPQLQAARAALDSARADLATAQQQWQWTRITAPFDALVVNRSINPGSYISAGTEVATLYSTDRVEIAVAFSEREWQMLPDSQMLAERRWPVQLNSVESGQQWQGYVQRVQRHLDDASRQRSLIVAVDQPFEQVPALQPGTFTEVRVPGKPLDAVWKLPASALSQRGEIWLVDKQQQLLPQQAEVLFSDATSLYVKAPDGFAGTWQVVVQPLSSYAAGTLVAPVVISPGQEASADE